MMETKSVIVVASWICVTILSGVTMWVTQRLDLWNATFIILLLGIAFAITFAIPFGLPELEQTSKRTEEQLTNITKQLEELSRKVEDIKKELED